MSVACDSLYFLGLDLKDNVCFVHRSLVFQKVTKCSAKFKTNSVVFYLAFDSFFHTGRVIIVMKFHLNILNSFVIDNWVITRWLLVSNFNLL